MRFGLLFATAASLIVHVLILWLLPTLPKPADIALPTKPARLQARLLPMPPEPPEAAAPLDAAKPSAVPQPETAPRRSPRSPVFTATTTPSAATVAPPGSSQIAEPAANGAPPLGTAPAQSATPEVATRSTPLDLIIRADKIPPRTSLQSTIEQQAIRPDAMARSFERVLEQTGPVTTEITQTRDASGNVTVKVRTPGGTYCLKNNTPPGATLYELKTLSGNCSNP
jgi:hypothetical protein